MVKRCFLFVAFLFLMVLGGPGLGQAAEYSHSYTFSSPVINEMGDGTAYPEMDGCWLKMTPSGAPMLPRLTAKLFIRPGETVESVKVDCAAPQILPGNYNVTPIADPVPMSMPQLAKAAVKNTTIYGANALYPGVTHLDMGTQILMGATIAMLQLCPVQYNPVTGEIAYYPQMTVTVVTRSGDAVANTAFRNRPSDRAAILAAVDNKEAFLETSKLMPTASATARQQAIPDHHHKESTGSHADFGRPSGLRRGGKF